MVYNIIKLKTFTELEMKTIKKLIVILSIALGLNAQAANPWMPWDNNYGNDNFFDRITPWGNNNDGGFFDGMSNFGPFDSGSNFGPFDSGSNFGPFDGMSNWGPFNGDSNFGPFSNVADWVNDTDFGFYFDTKNKFANQNEAYTDGNFSGSADAYAKGQADAYAKGQADGYAQGQADAFGNGQAQGYYEQQIADYGEPRGMGRFQGYGRKGFLGYVPGNDFPAPQMSY